MTRDFGSGGPFGFRASAQDGIRVYLNGEQKINIWGDASSTRSRTVNLTVPKGKHTIRVDIAAFTGKADVAFLGCGGRLLNVSAPSAGVVASQDVLLFQPIGLKVTRTAAGGVQLSWEPNAVRGASYNVYRTNDSPQSGARWTKLGTAGGGAPVFTDTAPVEGVSHTYVVTAADGSGNESEGSAFVTVVPVDRVG